MLIEAKTSNAELAKLAECGNSVKSRNFLKSLP
jgi:hypothetical protein